MLASEKMDVSERMDDYEQIIFHKYFYDLIISYRICHLDHQTSYFKVTFIQTANNLHLLVSFFSLQQISWLLFLFLNVFYRLIPWQGFLPQLFFKSVLIFLFLMLLQVLQQYVLLPNVFSRLIPWQVFLPQLSLKPLLIFIFLMLLKVRQQYVLLPNVFSRLIPSQVFLPQLSLKPLLIFIFLKLLKVQLLLAVISFFLLQPILMPSVLVIPL